MGNPVVHFEIDTSNPEKVQKFFSELFGWSINADNPMNYGLVDTNGGTGINGGIGPAPGPNMVTFYVEVPDVDEALTRIEKLGGKTMMPTTNVMEGVTIGIFTDPDGNAVGLVKSEPMPDGSMVGPSKGSGKPVVHFEVAGKDAAKIQSFYGEAFGWRIKADNPFNYGEVEAQDGRGIGGGVFPAQGDPYVTFYVLVDDLQACCDRAEALGGTTAMPPMTVTPEVSIAQIKDPEGNMVGLFKGMGGA